MSSKSKFIYYCKCDISETKRNTRICKKCHKKIKPNSDTLIQGDRDSNLRYPIGPEYYTHYNNLHYNVYKTGDC